MANYHPDTRYLNDFAAGTLSTGLAVMVKTHLEFCSECHSQVRQLEQLGAALFIQSADQLAEKSAGQVIENTVSSDLLDKVMNKLDQPQPPVEPKKSYQPINTELPAVVDKLVHNKLENLDWKKLGPSLNFSRLQTGDDNVELGFYHIKAGGKIPDHKHQGDEVTVVLKGSFSDADGIYKKGDFIVRSEGEHHSPVAAQDEDCLCLSALDKPIAFTGLYRLLNPFLKVHPA